ncbi:MAG: sugar ABC transporter permease [Anaerolineales bacterium]|nr:sugar ABC transporter permease [Anaerolineales bacterium]
MGREEISPHLIRNLRNRIRKRQWGSIVLFLSPAIALYLAFTLIPVFITFYNSVHVLDMTTWEHEYIGLAHYLELLPRIQATTKSIAGSSGLLPFEMIWGDKIFRLAITNSVKWAIASPLLEIPLAFLLALLLYNKVPLTRFFRVAWFCPMLISWVVTGIIFRWIFNNEWGVINSLLKLLGLGSLARNWLGLPGTALPALIGVTTWKFVGFNMVLLLAALSSIPSEILDAAKVDGSNQVQLLGHIIIPLVRPTVVNAVILSFIGKMKQFALVWVTTRGGPLYHTETVATYMQKRAFGWRTLDLGYPSAIAVLWFLVIFSSSLLFTWIFKRREVLEY